MKKLFLASAASNVLDEFVELLDKEPSEYKVAFVPTAADMYEDKWFVAADRDKLIALGFNVIDININGKDKEALEKEFKTIDIIFVAGGNTFYLLEKTRESGFDKIIKKFVEQGKYYIGSSAGSVLAGVSIAPAKFADDPSEAPNLQSYDGLKLVDKIILPHYEKEKYQEQMEKIVSEFSDMKDKMITLTDDQALVVMGEEVKIIQAND